MKLHELISASAIGAAIEKMLAQSSQHLGARSAQRGGRSRTPGPAQPAGSKLLRKAKDGMIGKGHPR
jgi:hypothetical protein